MLRHLIPFEFKTIRYYGFYRKKHPLHEKISKLISEEKHKVRKQLLKFEICILRFFHRDPFKCPKCGTKMKYIAELDKGGGYCV